MYQIIDIENWHRKEIYHFFSAFDEPFFGVTVHVNLQGAIEKANKKSIPLFGYYLHKLMMAVNEIDAFKLRILDGQVVKYEVIHASATLPRTDGSFGFSFIEYDQDVHQFIKNMDAESQRISRSHQLFSERNGIDCIHVSALPWLKFTALSHARDYKSSDSAPKISFGRIFEENDQIWMPCSIHLHHGLGDGADVGKLIDKFQQYLDT